MNFLSVNLSISIFIYPLSTYTYLLFVPFSFLLYSYDHPRSWLSLISSLLLYSFWENRQIHRAASFNKDIAFTLLQSPRFLSIHISYSLSPEKILYLATKINRCNENICSTSKTIYSFNYYFDKKSQGLFSYFLF